MFSIVVPVYNMRATLRATVASVLAQSFGRFELIIVDDGSTDASLAALDGLTDPRLRTLVQANRGCGAARNAGAAAARHEWVAFLDADDLWAPCHLAELDRIRRAHPGAGLIGASYRMSHKAELADAEPAPGRIGLVDYVGAVGDGEAVLCASSAAVRREVWQELGGFGAWPSGQDSEMWVRIAQRWPVATSRRATATYVQRTGGISDRRRRSGFGKPPRRLADLSPAVERVLELRAGAPSAERAGYDRFVGRYLHWRLREAVRNGDVATIRGLRRLYERPPQSWVDRCLLVLAMVPGPLVRMLCRAARGVHLRRIWRSLPSGSRPAERRGLTFAAESR